MAFIVTRVSVSFSSDLNPAFTYHKHLLYSLGQLLVFNRAEI